MSATMRDKHGALSAFDFRRERERRLADDAHVITNVSQSLPFFRSHEYDHWAEGDTRWMLYVSAPPQCGKTVLATAVAKDLQMMQHDQSPVLVVSVYMDPEDDIYGRELLPHDSADPPESLLSAILRQTMEEAEPISRVPAADPVDTSLPGLFAHLRSACTPFKKKFLIVDAYDVCPLHLRPAIQDQLSELAELGFSIMLTSAEPLSGRKNKRCDGPGCVHQGLQLYWHCQQCELFDLCYTCHAHGISCEHPGHTLGQDFAEVVYDLVYEDGLIEYIETELRERLDNREYNADLQSSLQSDEDIYALSENIGMKSGNTFGIAKALLDYLRDFQMAGLEEITHVLTRVSLPEADFFDMLVRKVQHQSIREKEMGLTALSIFAQVSAITDTDALTSKELADAVLTACPHLEENLSHVESQLIHCCKGFILDDLESDIQPFCGSAQTYLQENCDDVFKEVGADLADLCLTRLTCVPTANTWNSSLASDLRRLAEREPFTVFAAQYWGDFLRVSEVYKNFDYQEAPKANSTIAKALELLQSEERLATCLYLASQRGRNSDVGPGWRAVHLCAWFGLDKFLDQFIQDGVNLQETVQRRSPIMLAARRGHFDIVKRLLDAHADVFLEDTYGESVFVQMIKGYGKGEDESMSDILELLLPHQRSCEGTLATHTTPLIAAIEMNDLGLLQRLLASGRFNVNEKTCRGHTALWTAIWTAIWTADPEACPFDILNALLQQPDLAFEERDSFNRTVLHYAAEYCDAIIIEKMLRCQNCTPAIICSDDATGMTPVRLLFENDLLLEDEDSLHNTLLLFKENGADLACLDGHGRSLLHATTKRHHDRVLDLLLLEIGLSVHHEDANGWNPLQVACCHGHDEVVARLLGAASNISPRHHSGWTISDLIKICHLDAKTNLLDTLERTISDASSIRQALIQTPIWSLAIGEEGSMKRFESASISELQACDPRDGNTILHKAILEKEIELCGKLLDKMPDALNVPNLRGHKPLMLAIEQFEYTRDKIYFAVTKCLLQCAAMNEIQWPERHLLRQVRERKQWEMALPLIESGSVPILRQRDFENLMEIAIKRSSLAGVKALLAAGHNFLQRCSRMTLTQLGKQSQASKEVQEFLAAEEEAELHRIFVNVAS